MTTFFLPYSGFVQFLYPAREDKLTSKSQKLRRVLLLVGVVDSGVLLPVAAAPPVAWDKLMGDGLLLKTREPLRCLGTSLTSLTSGKEA